MISYDSTARLNQPAARTNDSDLDVPSSTRIHDPVIENREPDGANYDVPTDDNSLSRTPDGWERYIHPNGLPYYVNQTFHAVTWLNIQDSTALDRVEGYIKIMNEQIKATGGKMPKDWEMRVELSGDVTPISDVLHNGKDLCHKLLNHSRRRVFELKAGCEKREQTLFSLFVIILPPR
ncbi:hypothetical protein K439DRAFT_323814 [Ramaria rubella]|nr:hypothetical protein K439DRAFT_323814 [Ramaria rubella]